MTIFEALSDAGDPDTEPPGLETFDWGREACATVGEEMRRDGAHDAGHLARVFEHARAITRGERRRGRRVDWELVAAAVLFHDVVNLPKDADERASASLRSGRRASSFFEDVDGWSSERRQKLEGAIERHSYSRGLEPETLEGEILRDADRLEAIGAVGIARCFHVSGAMDGAVAHPADPFAAARSLDDRAYAVDHFFEKLLEVRSGFATTTGRELADDRHAFLERFLEQFASEIGASWSAEE